MTYPSRVSWQFRNVTRTYDFWPLLDSIQVDDSTDDVATFSCELVDPDSSITLQVEDEVWVKADGVKIFGGRVSTRGRSYRSEAGPRTYKIDAQDFTARLDDSVIDHPKARGAESLADRVDWVLGFLNFSLTTAGVSLPSGDCDANEYDGNTVREALDQLADEHRLSYYVDYEKDLHLFRTEVVTSPFQLNDLDPDYSTDFPYREWTESDDSVELANAAYTSGEKRRLWVLSSGSIATWGRQERAVQDSELVTTRQLQAAGDRANAELDQPAIDGDLVAHEPGLRAGMTFQLTNDLWGLSAVTRIAAQVTMEAIDPLDADGTAYLKTSVSYTDRRRARPRKRGHGSKGDADTEDGSALSFTRACMSVVRDRTQAYGGGTPAPLADTVAYSSPVPPAHDEVTYQAPAYRRSYLASDCPPGFQGGHTGWKVEEQWLEVAVGSLTGVVSVRVTFATSDLTCMDGKDLIYGYMPAGDGPPDDCFQFTELGRIPAAGGSFDVPANVLTASATNYLVIAPGWEAVQGVSCCDSALVNGLEGSLGGISPGGCEFQSGRVQIDIGGGDIVERVVTTNGGLTPWGAPTGAVDGSNVTYTLPDWNGKGSPEVRIGAVVYGPGADYSYDDEAGTVTMRFAPWVGAALQMRWKT